MLSVIVVVVGVVVVVVVVVEVVVIVFFGKNSILTEGLLEFALLCFKIEFDTGCWLFPTGLWLIAWLGVTLDSIYCSWASVSSVALPLTRAVLNISTILVCWVVFLQTNFARSEHFESFHEKSVNFMPAQCKFFIMDANWLWATGCHLV